MRRILPSSRITLSPNMRTSNSRFAIRRFNMFLLGLLLALMSNAQMPITPHGAFLASSFSPLVAALSLLGLWLLVAVLPLNLRLALLRDLVGCDRCELVGSALGFTAEGFRCWGCVSRGDRWWPLAGFWLSGVTVTADSPASDWAAEPGPLPAAEAISPDADL